MTVSGIWSPDPLAVSSKEGDPEQAINPTADVLIRTIAKYTQGLARRAILTIAKSRKFQLLIPSESLGTLRIL